MEAKGQTEERVLLEQLREILLTEDRAVLQQIKETLDTEELLAEKIGPIFEQRLAFFKKNFPLEYKSTVDKLIEDKLKNSQEELLNVIYPVMGNMVRKYIQQQFQLLKESIEERLQEAGEKLNIWKRVKNRVAGVSKADLLLARSNPPIIEEVFLIERYSGILQAHASRRKMLDPESVAGMMTAIKSFVEDAFSKKDEELDYIKYHNFKILIQNFRNYYIATVVEGSISEAERAVIEEKVENFVIHDYEAQKGKVDPNDTFESFSRLISDKIIAVQI